MTRVDELRQVVVQCFCTGSGPARLDELIQAVRDEENKRYEYLAKQVNAVIPFLSVHGFTYPFVPE